MKFSTNSTYVCLDDFFLSNYFIYFINLMGKVLHDLNLSMMRMYRKWLGNLPSSSL